MKEVKVKIDGKDFSVPADWKVIKACRENGIEIPHYCYHPDLSVAGNCRICMVGVKGMPRPVVACATPVTEGMEVETATPEVLDARKSVMEFLLINHPLDCPECDQAGECRLQDYSYEYGRDHGRFHEEKVVKSKSTMGPNVKYWGSRCIVCTRCVRFTDEISGTHELGVIYRGDRSEISTFPGKSLDNPLSLNTVDICPVGALVSADFLYQSRVWHLKSAPSLCPDCSVGCNTQVELDRKDTIKRITPRRNDAVNKAWMCDYGRLSFPYVHQDRLDKALVDGQPAVWAEARRKAVELLRRPGTLVMISAWNTCEAMSASKALVEALPGAMLSGYANSGREDEVFPGFTISGDKNPNRAGLRDVLGIEDAEASIAALADSDKPIETLLLVHGVPHFKSAEAMQKVMSRARNVILLDFARSELLKNGNVEVALPTVGA